MVAIGATLATSRCLGKAQLATLLVSVTRLPLRRTPVIDDFDYIRADVA
jgi:hypothetical protein